VKCLSRQPGFVYPNKSQGSALFNCQHIPQRGIDPQQASTSRDLGDGMGLQSFPVGRLDRASLFWGKTAGLCRLVRTELEKGPFFSQKPCRQGETTKGYREKVGLRDTGRGDSTDLSAPETCPSYSFLPAEEGFRQ